LIEKGTELGIDTFMFFNSRFTNYFTDNSDRWKKIGRQAMKQSLRYYLPEFRVFRSFDDFLDHTRQMPVRILADQSADLNWRQAIGEGRFSGEEIVFVIGPEGGLDQNEIKTALAAGFTGISFGDYRLRTETAVLGTAAVLNTLRD
jgi:16S rRNA (uracil1498-N3)-methyltransferase